MTDEINFKEDVTFEEAAMQIMALQVGVDLDREIWEHVQLVARSFCKDCLHRPGSLSRRGGIAIMPIWKRPTWNRPRCYRKKKWQGVNHACMDLTTIERMVERWKHLLPAAVPEGRSLRRERELVAVLLENQHRYMEEKRDGLDEG